MIKISRALISVSDKSNILELATVLQDFNIEIISTGGTATLLKENNIKELVIQSIINSKKGNSSRI